jgi:dihydrofolate reductase
MILNTVTVSLIAAIGKNRELGKGNELIFKIPEDMKFFREVTRGHAVIMGRKTYESIGHALPNRTNIVITHDSNFMTHDSNIKVAHSIEEALEFGKTVEKSELFVIGGAQIYALAMPYADKLYLTLVDSEVKDADAFFPDYSDFRTVVSERKSSDENYVYNFLELTH